MNCGRAGWMPTRILAPPENRAVPRKWLSGIGMWKNVRWTLSAGSFYEAGLLLSHSLLLLLVAIRQQQSANERIFLPIEGSCLLTRNRRSSNDVILFKVVSLLHRWEKHLIPAGATVSVEFAHTPHVCVGFLWVLRVLPTSHRCACEINEDVLYMLNH